MGRKKKVQIEACARQVVFSMVGGKTNNYFYFYIGKRYIGQLKDKLGKMAKITIQFIEFENIKPAIIFGRPARLKDIGIMYVPRRYANLFSGKKGAYIQATFEFLE